MSLRHIHDMSGYNTSGVVQLPAEDMFGLGFFWVFFYFVLCERFSVLDNLGAKGFTVLSQMTFCF